MKKIVVALLLGFVSLFSYAQFTPGVVLKAADLNAAIAQPTITGGSINNTPIGSVNPATGSFTTLNAITATFTNPIGVANGGTGAPAGTLNGLIYGNGTFPLTSYTGTSCTNQFIRGLNNNGVATCNTVGSSDLAASLSLTTPNIDAATGTSFTATGAVNANAFNINAGTGTATDGINGVPGSYLQFRIGSSVKTQIGSSGNVLINSTSDDGTHTLQVNGSEIVGALTATTVNGNTISPGSGTLSLGASKTGTISNTIQFIGTDGAVVNVGAGGTIGYNPPALTGSTASIGGSALSDGTCTSGTVTITGIANTMIVTATPVTYPGDGFTWNAFMSAANTAQVNVCAYKAGSTPTASIYRVRAQ